MSGAALEILGRVSLSAGVMILAAAALRLRFGGRTPFCCVCSCRWTSPPR